MIAPGMARGTWLLPDGTASQDGTIAAGVATGKLVSP